MRRGPRHSRVNEILFTVDDEIALVICEHDDQRPLSLNKDRQRVQAFNLSQTQDMGAKEDIPTPMATDLLEPYQVRGKGGLAVGPAQHIHIKGHILSKSRDEIHHQIAICHDSTFWGSDFPYQSPGSSIAKHDGGTYVGPINIELVTLSSGGSRSFRNKFTYSNPLVSPIAFSPDGAHIAGVSGQESSEIVILEAESLQSSGVAEACIHGHLAPIALLQYMPNGDLISLATDGVGRLCSSKQSDAGAPGALIKQFRVDTRYPPSLLKVSPDGELIVSVWGRQVALWYPTTNALTTYNLDEKRLIELWPLAISPDCRLMACRTDRGLDIIDVLTGNSCRQATWDRNGVNAATAAAFGNNGTLLATGLQNGAVVLHDVVVDVDATSGSSTDEAPPEYTKMDD
jgi:WD40 repeat protein